MKKVKTILVIALISTVFFSAGMVVGGLSKEPLKTQVIAKPKASHESWGDLYIHSSDTTETYGLVNMSSGIAEIKPGQQIHPPHQHKEEELLLIIQGNGTWSIQGKESPAGEGELMYSRPWDFHGLKNTGDETLKFFFAKWNSKGVDKAEKKD